MENSEVAVTFASVLNTEEGIGTLVLSLDEQLEIQNVIEVEMADQNIQGDPENQRVLILPLADQNLLEVEEKQVLVLPVSKQIELQDVIEVGMDIENFQKDTESQRALLLPLEDQNLLLDEQAEPQNRVQNVIEEVLGDANTVQGGTEDVQRGTEDVQGGTEGVRKMNVRKKIRQELNWKCNERKKKHQAGEAYLSKRNKWVPAREVQNKKDCLNNCKFKCGSQVSMNMRKEIFSSYYSLTQNEKHIFLTKVTERVTKRRQRKIGEPGGPNRRQYSFIYRFIVAGKMIRVCKNFFLGTLSISQKPVYNAHSDKDPSGTPRKDRRDRCTNSCRKLSEEMRNDVIAHIKKFPCMESHYCRSRTKRLYLEATLTVPNLYDLYLTWCTDNEKSPVKLSMYRRIFVTEFNYGFHLPKTDRCDTCENYKLHKSEGINITEEQEQNFQSHMAEKTAMRMRKKRDKESDIPILVFDLEIVITCPRAEIGKFFYYPKTVLYNLTAYLTTTKTVYCAIWSEALQGRTGNCLASAFIKILNRVLCDNNITNLITWSDSCVAQNRNSFISFAVLTALREHSELQNITMMYSIAGHGAVQEVDSIHSRIESYMKRAEFFSPLGFMKNLKSVNKNHPYVVLQMRAEDFRNYEECAAQFVYKNVPFSKVSCLRFTKELCQVEFKTSHTQDDYKMANILNTATHTPRCIRTRGVGSRSVRTRGRGARNNVSDRSRTLEVTAKVLKTKKEVSKEKIDALKKIMMLSMPEIDKEFYRALLSLK